MTTMRYGLTVTYDRHLFHGSQTQPNERAVQSVIEKILKKMTEGKRIVVHGSGRTDASVHTKDQIIHFDYSGKEIPVRNMTPALNVLMLINTVSSDSEIVDSDFHVQCSAKGKRYRYAVDQYRFTDPFNRSYTGHYPCPLDTALVKRAAKDLTGEHDFANSAANGGQITDKVRTIYYVNITSDPDNKKITSDSIGNGFLYNMVRVLVGTLLGIGNKERPVDNISRVLTAKDR